MTMSKTLWLNLNTLNTSISPGVAFKPEDASELPYLLKQKYYRSFVAKLQFAATWILFDISFAVSQLHASAQRPGKLNGQRSTI